MCIESWAYRDISYIFCVVDLYPTAVLCNSFTALDNGTKPVSVSGPSQLSINQNENGSVAGLANHAWLFSVLSCNVRTRNVDHAKMKVHFYSLKLKLETTPEDPYWVYSSLVFDFESPIMIDLLLNFNLMSNTIFRCHLS